MKGKGEVIKFSVLVISIFVLFLSVTYAFINMSLTGTKRQVITAGNLSLELQEDENNLAITDAMPMYDEVGMIGEAFTFRLINISSTEDVSYSLRLIDITTETRLDTRIVKYGLKKEEKVHIDFLSNLKGDVLDRGIIEKEQSIHYELRLWIDRNVTEESQIKNKSLRYKLGVSYGQMLEDGDFKYEIESVGFTNNQIELGAHDSKIIDMNLTSFNNIETGYEIYYKVLSPIDKENSIEAGYIENTKDFPFGVIEEKEQKEMQLIFNNMGNDKVILEVGIAANLPHNKLELETDEISLSKESFQKNYVYEYTGDYQTFTAPIAGTYKIELWGAGVNLSANSRYHANKGAYTSGEIQLTLDKDIYIYVGEASQTCEPYNLCSSAWNGGGEGGFFTPSYYPRRVQSGSGATDIRLVNGAWNNPISLRSRIMVAGGSGAAYNSAVYNSSAGGLVGYTGRDYNNGTGGTQTSGGVSNSESGGFGYGGKGRILDPTVTFCNDGYGGGSGYYGGGGGLGGPAPSGSEDIPIEQYKTGSGGGGSSFISGHAGCIAIKSEDDQTPKVSTYSKLEDSYHYSGKIFTNTVMIDGKGYNWTTEIGEKIDMPTHDLTSTMVGNNGNGYARITYLES